MSKVLSLLMFVFAMALGCGSEDTDEPASNQVSNGTTNNTANNASTNNASNQTGNNGVDCIAAQNDVASAIRALPRECITDNDCIVVERAANCECANSVSFRSDLSEFEESLSRLDAGSCGHPFACAQQSCSYDSGFTPSELVPVCDVDQTCTLREALTCDAFADGAKGGLVTAGACNSDEDCVLRDDLNPCGCDEGVTNQFPVLVAQSIYDLIELNTTRCDFTCDSCPTVTEARCIDNLCTEM